MKVVYRVVGYESCIQSGGYESIIQSGVMKVVYRVGVIRPGAFCPTDDVF